MKRNLNKLLIVLIGLVVGLLSCQPEEFSLGEVLTKSDLKYSITQNPNDPNMVILESMTSGAAPIWNTPTGRSVRVSDTVRIPFAGDYEFTYGVMSAGGIVKDDVFQLTISTNNFSYIDDPMWELLTGGVGNEKTWYLDLDADAQSKYFLGPLYFSGLSMGWGNECVDDVDCWNWDPDYPGNAWLMPEGDYGSMTFSLKGGASVSVDHKMLGRTENGTYFLDAEAKTLSMTDAGPLHDEGRDGQVVDWGKLKVISITENTLQLAALRDEGLSGEGPALLIYNYISKDYADNWTPPLEEDPEPALPEGWEGDISTNVSYEIKWVLSPETPFNWAGLDGMMLNDWNTVTDYPDWTGFNASIPATYEDFSLTLNSQDNTVKYVDPSGAEATGTYALDEKGIYTFDGVTPGFNICSWVNLFTTAENQWRILQIEKDATGSVTGMWVGALDPTKPEYAAFKLIPQAPGAAEKDPVEEAKKLITAKTWKLDSDRTYDVTTSWGAEQGPMMFSDFATWAWNPLPGEHYASGEASVDYGTMKFEMDGTVVVNQHKRVYTYDDGGATVVRSGMPEATDVLETDEVVTLNGTWSLDLENNKITMSVGLLHPWTCDYAVADWGAITIHKLEENALFLQALRDKDLSGEDEFLMTYLFVPAE
ncbi:hypothetical protein R9C00_24240 [Flammeovirgaceae bacterium SG7u.111]|nr:hypothetical protein [Flammeovirgaceae bacterium SG7u.132]WPO34812.1 hypothetical protein R9C00_24240 [Flammeovirgaceae bacterium SG7u.111]